MKNVFKERELIFTTTALALVSVYSYMHFGVFPLIGGVFAVLIFLFALIIKKSIISNIFNVVLALFLAVQAVIASSSNLVETDSSCLDICIGEDIPLLLLRGLTVIILIIVSSLLIKRFVEKK